MNHEQPIKIEKKFRPQLHYFVMLAAWLVFIATAALYCYFVKSNNWRPNIFWWLLSTCLNVFSVCLAGWLVVRRFWHRSRRGWSIGIFMLTLLPLLMFACFLWSVVTTANQRGDLKLTLSTRAFGIWVGNYFELEARWRYMELTEGKYVQLFHRGDIDDPEKLVREMDQHIASMSQSLDAQPPEFKTAWVRGPLFGQTGRAIGLWAICDVTENIDQLQYLDVHEVAHTTITALCDADQEPPMLLAEGWATYQSQPPNGSIAELARLKKRQTNYTLGELTGDKYYGRSIAPAYSHGGPLVEFLIGKYGKQKFRELYEGVRRESFQSDASRILGEDWSSVESNFWDWLASENAKRTLDADIEVRDCIQFDDDKTRDAWQAIKEAVLDDEKRHPFQTSDWALNISTKYNGVKNTTKIVCEGSNAWCLLDWADISESTWVHRTTEENGFVVTRSTTNDSDRVTSVEMDLSHNSDSIMEVVYSCLAETQANRMRTRFSPVDIFLPSPYEPFKIEVEIISIRPDEDNKNLLRIDLELHWDGETSQASSLWVDSNEHYRVVKSEAQHDPETRTVVTFQTEPDDNEKSQLSFVNSDTFTSNDGSTTKVEDYQTSIRNLTEAEIAELKQEIDSIREQYITNRFSLGDTLRNKILSPLGLLSGWLLIAVTILGIDMIGERVKFRVNATSSNQKDIQD